MSVRIQYIILFCLYCLVAQAEDFTTLVHHKDGRVFAILSNQIDSITHTTDGIDDSYYDLTDSIVYPSYMRAMMETLLQAQAGIPNSKLCTDENRETLFAQNADYQLEGAPWTHGAMFSLIDDDVIDEFIPSSYPGQSITNSDKKVGGYFSLLFPFLKSLEVKYGVPLTCGLSMEGHRVGLTGYGTDKDECTINENGQLVQQITTHNNWDILCHSMTARVSPMSGNIFIVDSLNSQEAQDMLVNGTYEGSYSFKNTGVYDRKTLKNYTISKDKTTWNETPLKYIQPYCMNKKTGKWTYNESYPVDYQIGEWKTRADSLGFIYPDIMVHWGTTASARLIQETRKYFSHSIDPGMANGVNNVPLSATIHRINCITTDNKNAYNAAYFKTLKHAVDNALETNGWLVLMSHFNTIYYYNGYLDEVTYPERENNYNTEWINPLMTEEIRNMDKKNYWDNPPARLGISNWGEWRPAKGTQLYGLYKIFEYALEKGMQNVNPSQAIAIIGNKVNIGTYRDNDLYPREKGMQLHPIDMCYFVVGADGSIKYHSEK